MKIIAFFNHKANVGKTILVHHLAWMYAEELGLTVIAADFDPQANLTTLFLEEDELPELWPDGEHPQTILGTISPLLQGTNDIADTPVHPIADKLGLIAGDLGLSLFEEPLSTAWLNSLDGDELAFRTLSAFYRALLAAAQSQQEDEYSQPTDVALVDMGPNLGAINLAILIAADAIVIPLISDRYLLQGIQPLGSRLSEWRNAWQVRLQNHLSTELLLPRGSIQPIGYVALRHRRHFLRSVSNYPYWMTRIPTAYRQSILNESLENVPEVEQDNYCLSILPNYWSLMQMTQESHKPMFHLKPAHGAIGSHALAVKDCYRDFKQLAKNIANACAIPIENDDFRSY